MPEPYHADIRSLDLFAQMESDKFEALMRGSYVHNFPPQIQLITEGEQSDFLHIVLSGTVELFCTWNGRETSMATVRPVSTFILAATIKDAPYLMSARTMEKSRIALLPSQDVRAVFDADAKFARAIVTELAQCYRSVVKHTKDLKLRNGQERLANYLLREHRAAGGAPAFELRTDKRRLAALLGMTPENLSRSFNGLRAQGVSTKGSTVSIEDPDHLREFAKPSPLIDDQSL
ncbi:MAG: helix-turn-helix domain-containing protein [Alphaproteobacteria bacterium]|nr:helix-turn-helix domain-containing protein [Alphaproteobacteria bacterium]